MRGPLEFRSFDNGPSLKRLRDDCLGYTIPALHCKSPDGVIMDLGIRGRSAIVCASSQGLGKGCAQRWPKPG